MPEYLVTCRGVFDQKVIAALDAQKVYWMQGGPTLPEPRRHRHHLTIVAGDPGKALFNAQVAVTAAGGEASDFDVLIEEGFRAPGWTDS
jgi:hypothetical protein